MAFGVLVPPRELSTRTRVPEPTEHADTARIRPSQQKQLPFPLLGAVTLVKLINLFIQHNKPVGIAYKEQHVIKSKH